MNLFSIILVIYILYIFIIKEHLNLNKRLYIELLSLAIVFDIHLHIGYFMKFGDSSISYGELLTIIVTICSVFMIINKKYLSRRKLITMIFFILSVLIGIFLLAINPYDKPVIPEESLWDAYYFGLYYPNLPSLVANNIKELIHVIFYGVVLFTVFETFAHIDWEKLEARVVKYLKIILVYGIFEFVMIKFAHSNLSFDFAKFFFGDKYFNKNSILDLLRGENYGLIGLTSEPSYYAYALLLTGLIFFAKYVKSRNKKDLVWMFIALFLLIESLSFTAVLLIAYFIIVIFIYKLKAERKRLNRVFYISVCILTFFLILNLMYLITSSNIFDNNYFFDRIRSSLAEINNLDFTWWDGDYTKDVSSRVRFLSIIGTFEYFTSRPLFGVGLGTTYSHGSGATILASIGLIGTFAWTKLTFFSFYKKHSKYYIISIMIWFIMIIYVSNGLFVLYGLENIIFVQVLSKLMLENNVIEKKI